MILFTKQNKDTDKSENKYMNTEGKAGEGWNELRDWDGHVYTPDSLDKIIN